MSEVLYSVFSQILIPIHRIFTFKMLARVLILVVFVTFFKGEILYDNRQLYFRSQPKQWFKYVSKFLQKFTREYLIKAKIISNFFLTRFQKSGVLLGIAVRKIRIKYISLVKGKTIKNPVNFLIISIKLKRDGERLLFNLDKELRLNITFDLFIIRMVSINDCQLGDLMICSQTCFNTNITMFKFCGIFKYDYLSNVRKGGDDTFF